jgi:NAD(P)-dependent dehydrogenase (short-subunit alcohol dehydrogenase family)
MKALIIGASGDLGSSIARFLASEGYKLVLHGHSNKIKLENLADEINADAIVLGDITIDQEVKQMIHQANISESISGLVYAAGINPTAETLESTKVTDWVKTMSVNLTGAFLSIKYSLPFLRKENHSSIVLVSSVFGLSSPAHRSAYGASKHGLTGLVQSVAKEEGGAVRINGVCPGPMWSENVRQIFDLHAKSANLSVEDYIKSRQRQIPYGRFLEMEECSSLVSFLLSKQSSFLTGEMIRISGGEY